MPNYRIIPSIEQLRQRPAVRALEARVGHAVLVEALRVETQVLRELLASGAAGAPEHEEAVASAIEARLEARVGTIVRPSLARVINATGVIIHTNLGRAPLPAVAAARVSELAAGYCNLEYDLDAGARGRRDTHAERLLCRLTGAESAVIVNNNAAATLLILAALARGREVIVSRGELVEIGGGFRVPDVMAQSGAILREVGTTNRTRVADYGAAIGDRTALILRVHPSNFRIEGFTERPALEELVALGRQFGIPVAEDLGSGYLGETAGLPRVVDEPDVQQSLAAGADVVCFSGDKLLGGPQAGIILGRRDVVTTIRRHPLMRALRVDKLTYAALEATLQLYVTGRAAQEVPVARMIAMSRDEIATRASALAERFRAAGYDVELRNGISTIGGGSAPGSQLPTVVVAVAPRSGSPDALAARWRAADPPLVARIEDERVVLDLRTVLAEDEGRLDKVLTGGSDGWF